MNIENVKIMYFLGIGGIGMSALARYCQSLGIEIHGYDLTPSKLTSQLISEGMKIHFTEDVSQFPKNADLVVITPAIPTNNAELKFIEANKYEIVKRSQLLGLLSKINFTIAVAGTHGKTSIGAMISHLLFSSGRNVTALIGGIMSNYESNAIISKSTDYLVLEADEFDRSFLWLEPNISVISSMDDDHLDVYNDSSELTKAFIKFAKKTPDNGLLVYQESLINLHDLDIKKTKYGQSINSDIRAENIKVIGGYFIFDLVYQSNKIHEIKMQVPGRHYIENALAAATVCIELGLSDTEIKSGLESFIGVERRFEYKLKTSNRVFVDDYAHHPTEISSTLNAVKELYPNKKITVVFQPHLFSRTRDFATGFAQSLEIADDIILLDIYPARELPIEGVSSKIILDKINNSNKSILSNDELLSKVEKTKPEVLLTLGAGDIGLLVDELLIIMEKR